MKNEIEAMITDITATTTEAEDYTGEDGLLYCGKCHTPKEAYFAEGKTCFGRDRHPTDCDCQRAAREKQQAAESRQKHLEKVEDLKRRGFTDPAMRNWTFEHDNGRNPQTETARFYVESLSLIHIFANIGQIPKFEKLIATIRSREISASIILQSQSQLKAIYKDNADTIVGNCDTTLFLGGKEKTTLKEISEILGKETIDSFNTSETRGRELSHGLNYQNLGKQLMTEDEIAVDVYKRQEPSLSVWCRKHSPASRRQRSGSSGHALQQQSREFPSWKSCSAKSMRTTF